jgi:hypothetical protein
VDDRDKDLTHLFVRDLDEIPLPARGEWRRVSGRETTAMRSSRYLLTVGAVVAVLAIALIIGLQLNQRQQTAANPSPSPTASATVSASPVTLPGFGPSALPSAAATPGATATPAAGGAIYNDSFGFIVLGGDGPPHAAIYKEGSDTQVGGITVGAQALAVSADGKQIAYWSLAASGSELKVYTVGDASDRALVTLGSGQRGGGVAWSSDGQALLYSTESGNAGVGGGPNTGTLNIWELAASGRHGTTIDTQTNTGWLYRPIAWDRTTNLAAAQLTGEGGFMGKYETVRINPDNSFSVTSVDTTGRTMLMSSIRASSDAKYVLGVTLSSGDINWWPIDNFDALKSQAGAGKRGAQWRPGTHEIGFVGPSDQFWLGDVDKAGALGLCCTAFSGVPASSTLATFRADGTAVVLGVLAPSRQFGADYTLVRFGNDPKATSGDRVTFQSVLGLVGSVRFR